MRIMISFKDKERRMSRVSVFKAEGYETSDGWLKAITANGVVMIPSADIEVVTVKTEEKSKEANT